MSKKKLFICGGLVWFLGLLGNYGSTHGWFSEQIGDRLFITSTIALAVFGILLGGKS